VDRYLVRAELEQSPAVVSALTAASMAVQEPDSHGELANTTLELKTPGGEETVPEVLDALTPPDAQATMVAVNAPSGDEAVARVREALARWGRIKVEVVGRDPL